MSSKVAFRARNLDANRALPVLRDHELPPEFVENGATSAPRITQQEITTGMEKEEETEHHLQQALTAQQVYKTAEQQAIPVPEITENTEENHRRIYRRPFKLPKSLINYQAYMFESDEPVYDADEKDLVWLSDASRAEQLDVASFERMIQRLEEGSSAQRLVTLEEAHLLLKNAADELLIAAVYQHWHEKRVGCESLVPVVLTEKRDGSNNNNPYVAFRRRKEKMQTRKNRKNDELSYERMLKLRLNLSKASLLLELIKRREEAKRELCSLVGNVFERRYAAGDFSATAMREAELTVAKLRNAMALPSPLAATSFIKFTAVARSPSACAALQSLADRHAVSHKRRAALDLGLDEQFATRRASRRAAALPADSEELLLAHKRRRVMPRPPPITAVALPCASAPTLPPAEHNVLLDSHKPGWRHEDVQTAANIDCEFAFRRKAGCRYAAPADRREHSRSRFSLVCLPPRHSFASWRLCYARRRVARSRRVVLDVDKRLRIPVSALDCSPVENGVPQRRNVTSTSTPVPVPVWRSVLAAVQHALCAYCDPATRQCSRKRTLCSPSRLDALPHLNDLDALVNLQEACPNVYLPRCADLCDAEPHGALTRPPDSTGLLDLVRLYLDDSSPRLPEQPVHSVANGTRPAVDAPSRHPNGVNGAHDRSCATQAVPHMNGNNNNDAGRLTTPSRLPSIGKRLTDSLGGLLGGIAPIPMAALENGKSPSPTGSQPSAADSESDAEALISEQVRTHTPIST